eukprot:Em0020g683a
MLSCSAVEGIFLSTVTNGLLLSKPIRKPIFTPSTRSPTNIRPRSTISHAFASSVVVKYNGVTIMTAYTDKVDSYRFSHRCTCPELPSYTDGLTSLRGMAAIPEKHSAHTKISATGALYPCGLNRGFDFVTSAAHASCSSLFISMNSRFLIHATIFAGNLNAESNDCGPNGGWPCWIWVVG